MEENNDTMGKVVEGKVEIEEKNDSCQEEKKNDDTLKRMVEGWKTEEFRKSVKNNLDTNEILVRMKEVTELMTFENNNSKQNQKDNDSKGGESMNDGLMMNEKLEKLDWDKIYEVSTTIIDNYTKDVDEVLAKLDELSKKQYLWQEAAFMVDAHRGVNIFNKSKDWISTKENYLDLKRDELGSSAEIIKNTIQKLTNKG